MVKKNLSKEDERYVRRLKNRFIKLEENEADYSASMDDYREMQDIRNELDRLGFKNWHSSRTRLGNWMIKQGVG